MPDLFDPTLTKPLAEDRRFLESTKVPIITLSAVTKEDVKKLHNLPNENESGDIVLSRAHFSMALALAKTAWGKSIDPKKAWLVDPTNYITKKDWLSVDLTEEIGKTVARHQFLKIAKDLVDKFGRKKIPIIDSVTTPLLFLTQQISRPILSLHISAGNVLLDQGKTIVQVVTDPHIREDYLKNADNPRLTWCVFDEPTKIELLEKAALLDKSIEPNRVVVTGPPIDPTILASRQKKQPWRSGPLKLCITTGGLGTNKSEILKLCRQLFPSISARAATGKLPLQLVIYCGTQPDIYQSVLRIANDYHLTPAPLVQTSANLRIIYHPQLTDANNQLLKYGFPWAHGFVTKPSGDMAYDAVGAGCFLLTLSEWGEWEHAIRQRFEQLGIGRRAQVEHIMDQLEVLSSAEGRAQSWIEKAQASALSLSGSYVHGCENILETVRKTTT